MLEAKRDQRVIFYVSGLMGLTPLLAHLVVAGAEAVDMISVPGPVPFRDQNWLGHLVFFGIALASGSIVNVMRFDGRRTRRMVFFFGNMLAALVLLWVVFGIMAVSGQPPPFGAWLVAGLLIVLTVACAYIVDMEVALATARSGETA